MPKLVFEFQSLEGVATTVVIAEDSGIETMLTLLTGREGETLMSVSLKETRDELRRQWRSMVQIGHTEQGFADWVNGISREGLGDDCEGQTG